MAFREVLRRMTWDGKIVLEPQPDGSYVANSFFMPLVVPPRTPKTQSLIFLSVRHSPVKKRWFLARKYSNIRVSSIQPNAVLIPPPAPSIVTQNAVKA